MSQTTCIPLLSAASHQNPAPVWCNPAHEFGLNKKDKTGVLSSDPGWTSRAAMLSLHLIAKSTL